VADATHDVADGMRRHAAAETDDDNYTPSRLTYSISSAAANITVLQ